MADGAKEFDYIVVGGGTTGCALAARLSEDAARTVCLLETVPQRELDGRCLILGRPPPAPQILEVCDAPIENLTGSPRSWSSP